MNTHQSLLSFNEALEILLQSIKPMDESTLRLSSDADGQILYQDIFALRNVPSADNSAMDGFALCFCENAANTYKLIGSSFAGKPFNGHLKPGEAVRIFTGAVIPDGANSVIAQEYTSSNDNIVNIFYTPKPGENIRRKGEDLMKDELALPSGTRLGPVEIGLLISLGVEKVETVRPLKVAIFSTGDELRQPGEKLAPGDIYDSNRFALLSLMRRFGAETLDLGCFPDNEMALRQAVNRASQEYDALITSGGVSVGDADFTVKVLQEQGKLEFWKVAMKPGKPFASGHLRNPQRENPCYFFGLPGNPVSALLTCYLLVLPALRKLRRERKTDPITIRAKTTTKIYKKPGRTDFQRGTVSINDDGRLVVHALKKQSSGMLTSITQANCLIILPQEQGDISAGSEVEVMLFDSIR